MFCTVKKVWHFCKLIKLPVITNLQLFPRAFIWKIFFKVQSELEKSQNLQCCQTTSTMNLNKSYAPFNCLSNLPNYISSYSGFQVWESNDCYENLIKTYTNKPSLQTHKVDNFQSNKALNTTSQKKYCKPTQNNTKAQTFHTLSRNYL